jgi:hypothetical protein
MTKKEIAKTEYIERLKDAIEQLHHCRAGWIGTGPVKEMLDGKTIWEGSVETFVLIGHPKAKHAYAWSQKDRAGNGEERCVSVLAVPPVDSPQAAVKAAVTDKMKRKKSPEKTSA